MSTLTQKAGLLKGLLTGERAFTGPIYVDVDLSNVCNLKCLGCPYHSSAVDDRPYAVGDQSFMSMEIFGDLCRDLKSMGTRQLILQGAGEPFLHPHLMDIVRQTKEAGFQVMILTNGTLLDRETIETLIEARLDAVKVSLWAATPEEYQRNYPENDPDNFQRVQEGLRLLSTLKRERGSPFPEARLHYIINRNSFRSLEGVPDWAGSLGIQWVTYNPLHPVRGASREQMLTPEEEHSVKLALERAGKKLESLKIEHNRDEAVLRYELGNRIWEKLPCYIAWYHARIRTDGEVTSCGRCGFSFGNLTRQSFGEIWNSAAIRDTRRLLLTREGLASVQDHCNCNFCCFAKDNMKIHRLFKWISPVLRLGRGVGAVT